MFSGSRPEIAMACWGTYMRDETGLGSVLPTLRMQSRTWIPASARMTVSGPSHLGMTVKAKLLPLVLNSYGATCSTGSNRL